MIFNRILSIFLILFTVSANAGTDIKNLKDSVFKIFSYGSDGRSVATAFSLEEKNEKYLITNNHVCSEFYKSKKVVLIPTQTFEELPQTKAQIDSLDNITSYYMDQGSDICIMKSSKSDTYKSLSLGSKKAEPTETILVSGFVGRSLDLMYVEGKVYGTITVNHPSELKDCLFDPPIKKNVAAGMTCTFFTNYPEYEKKTLQVAVNNIAPGFSGSPVLQDGKVVGIVSRYFVPTSGYSNGDTIFFSLDDIKKTIANSKSKLIDVKSTEYKLYLKITDFDEQVRETFTNTENKIKNIIKEMMSDRE